MIRMGIDLSLNSTGCTIYDTDTLSEHFFIITNKISSKWLKMSNRPSCITIFQYEKTKIESDWDYEKKEIYKTKNLLKIIDIINNIITTYQPSVVIIEGISFNSSQTRSIIELAALNYLVREICFKNNIEVIIASPTALKKFATGNGACDKDLMVESFFVLHPNMKNLKLIIKIDDIADSFFLSQYNK